MDKKNFYVDIHCHPTFRAFGSEHASGKMNHWEETHNPEFDTPASRWARMQTRNISKVSQTNFYKLAEGNVRVIINSLLPVEKGFLQFRKLPSMLVGKKTSDMVLMTATGATSEYLKMARTRDSYFEELLEQYKFLTEGQGPSPCGKYSYKVVRNYAEIKEMMNSDPNSIAVIPAIEGGHALGVGSPLFLKKNSKKLKKELEENIGIIKSWEHPPFVMNLVHMFWNQLSGHCRSLKPPMYTAFNQTYGLQKGITDLGWLVLNELLSPNNGRRIHIDTKHLSVKARREYFEFVDKHNYLNKNEKIPIISTHTGVNGFKTLAGSIKRPDKPNKLKNSYFHNWSINISDEEILAIHRSGGMLGMMIDKSLLGGTNMLIKLKELENEKERKEKYMELLLKNIFHIVKVIDDKSAWDIITMGTDYDGLITHIETYPTAANFPDIHHDLVAYLKNHNFHKELWYGYEPEEIAQKIMQTNAIHFLERYFI